ncbi:hypothetical protein G7Y79_00060g092610 [Physcia stellaris]|nr:hypothetical protein G7Y79_00060g092610 [Physcia stellaris]
MNDDATDEDESETDSETEDDEDEDEEMPDQPLHSSTETCTENSSINASSHGMDGAGDTFMEDLHAATAHARASSPAASNAPKPPPSTPSTPSSRKIRTISSHSMDGASNALIEDLQAAARGHARASSPAASIASNAANPSPSAPSTPSSHQAHPPTTPSPRSPPAPPSIGECIFPPNRKTYLPVPSDGYSPSSSSLPSNPLPPTSTPTARLYSLAFHITAQCLQQAKALKEMGERYAELASEMGTCWEGWRGVVRRFDDVVRRRSGVRMGMGLGLEMGSSEGWESNGDGIGDGF